ncbi:hypothetical protein OG21DRAFT_1505732 [Imleria badia]|nr:hypothetical protein OG21DRAFT_1505732 [Imleria badia]
MSTTQDDRTASPARSADRKRRRLDDVAADSDVDRSQSTQISTWEIPPDVVQSLPESPKASPVDQPIPASSVPIDSDDPIVVSPKVDRIRVPPSVPEPLSTYTCPICFSAPTNATLTPCGHICCGLCLFTAVKSTIRRNMVVAMDRAPAARCPVCRAEIPGWDGRGGGVVGLKMQVLYSL